MTIGGNKFIERRLYRIGACLLVMGSLLTWILFGLFKAVSFLLGGTLAASNFVWFQWSVGELVGNDPKSSKRRVLAGFFLRLLLIPLALYVMMRFLFFSLPAAVAGLAVFYCSVFVEGVLEAVGRSSK